MRPISYTKTINELVNDMFLKFYFKHIIQWVTIHEEILELSEEDWNEYTEFNLQQFNLDLKYSKSYAHYLTRSLKFFVVSSPNCWESYKLSNFFWLKSKKIITFYLQYVYYFFNFFFLYNFKKKMISFYQFRGFYDYFFMRIFINNFLKFRGAKLAFSGKFYRLINNNTKINFKNFTKEYYPILSLFIITDLCFLFRPRNLFLMLNFYGKVFLFHTAGIDNGHEGRKKQPIQVRCLSNILWHLLFRERCTKINIRFLNFRNKAIFFLTMLTHLKYIKRFKNKTVNFIKFILEFKQSFGFTRGKKLAIRKRFVVRKHSLNHFSFENYERDLKKKKKNDI